MMTMSSVSAFLRRSRNSTQAFCTHRARLLLVWTRAAFMIHIFLSRPSSVSRISWPGLSSGISWAAARTRKPDRKG